MPEEKPDEVGIAGLPKAWAVAVQLVGTFGLAVFLVLYYLFVMQPAEAKRYDELSASVNTLIEIVRERQSLVTREQAERLRGLFVQAAASEARRAVLEARGATPDQARLAKDIERRLMLLVDELRGLRVENQAALSEQLANGLRILELPDRLAEQALGEWQGLAPGDLELALRDELHRSLRELAMAK